MDPLPLRVLLDEAATQTRRHLRAVFLPVALPVAALAASMPIVQALWLNPFAGGTLPSSTNFLAGMLGTMAVGLAYGVLNSLAKGALTVAALDALAGRPIAMGRAWATVFRPRVLGTLLLSWLAMGGGFLLCILPGLVLAVLFSVLMPVVVTEGRAGVGALMRSASLLGHNPQRQVATDPRFKAFVVMLVGYVINGVVGFVVNLPAVVIQQVMMFRAIAAGETFDPGALMARLTWIQVPSAALNVVVQMVVQAYVAFALAMLFNDLVERRDAADLEAAVGRLAERGSAPQGA